jgi:hypothetical protein
MIGLVRAIDRDPRKLSSNHQVVVYGYHLEGSQVTLRVYDPNWPGEEVTLGFDAGDPNGSIRPTYSTTDAPLVCFFRPRTSLRIRPPGARSDRRGSHSTRGRRPA